VRAITVIGQRMFSHSTAEFVRFPGPIDTRPGRT
jgi:hypothetical protein